MKKLLTTLTALSVLLIATASYAQGKVYTETELKIQLPFGEVNNTESSKTYTVERVIDGDFISRDEAISIAEQFIIDNGYTDISSTIPKGEIVRESLEWSNDIEKILASRKGELQLKAVGAKSFKGGSWLVAFLRKDGKTGRGVKIDSKGEKIRMAHQDVNLDIFIDQGEKTITFTVERVIDGDTIKLTNGERVRLIGIDTPESKPNDKAKRDSKRTGKDLETINKMGQEAMEFVKGLIKPGKEVWVKLDVQERDKYGRLLAYIYDPNIYDEQGSPYPSSNPIYFWEQGMLFYNATIIKSGYATPMTIPPNVKYADLFQELYEEAREQKRGLWQVVREIPKHLQEKPNGLYMRVDNEIVDAPVEDLALAKTYPRYQDKGEIRDGQRITIMTHKLKYKIGEEVRVLHALEAIEEGHEVYVMGPKEIFGEYINGELMTAEKPDQSVYDGAVMQGPWLDFHYDITTYSFDKPGIHAIQWKRGGAAIQPELGIESNILLIEIVPSGEEE